MMEHGNSKDANDKALVMQCKGRAQHPPFAVKIIHWAKVVQGWEAFPKWKRGPSTKLSHHDFGEHPSPFAKEGVLHRLQI
jgi:hypothetical protein